MSRFLTRFAKKKALLLSFMCLINGIPLTKFGNISTFVIEMAILNKFLPVFAVLAIASFSFAQDNLSGELSSPVSEEITAPAEVPVAETVSEPAPMSVAAAPAIIASSGLPISLAPRLSGGISGFYGHKRVNNLFLRSSYSFGAGIVVLVPLIDGFLSLDPAIQYSYSRTHSEWSKNELFSKKVRKATVSSHALEIPVLARLDLTDVLFVEIGPQFNFILSSTTETEISSALGGKESYDTPDLNLFVFGGAVGIGYNVTKEFSVDIRGQYGFFEYAEDTYGKPWIIHLGLSFRVL